MRKKNKVQNSKSESSALTSTERGRTLIGSASKFTGEMVGEEDLLVQGQFEGTIDLKKSNVTIGKSGCLKADVYGKIITIEGKVQGNLFGEEEIILLKSGRLRGNMLAPRVNVEAGAKFQGKVDMDTQNGEKQREAKRRSSRKSGLKGGRPRNQKGVKKVHHGTVRKKSAKSSTRKSKRQKKGIETLRVHFPLQ